MAITLHNYAYVVLKVPPDFLTTERAKFLSVLVEAADKLGIEYHMGGTFGRSVEETRNEFKRWIDQKIS